MHGEDRSNIKTQLIIVALKFAEFPDHISMEYANERVALLSEWPKVKTTFHTILSQMQQNF